MKVHFLWFRIHIILSHKHHSILIIYFLISGIGGCNIDDMPEIKNGKKVVEHGTRGSVFKYRCNSPFRLFGHHRPISCGGGNKWNIKHIPVCTSKLILIRLTYEEFKILDYFQENIMKRLKLFVFRTWLRRKYHEKCNKRRFSSNDARQGLWVQM